MSRARPETLRNGIPRFVDDPPRTAGAALWVALRRAAGWRGGRVVYHAVPSALAANRAQAVLAVQRGEDPLAVTARARARRRGDSGWVRRGHRRQCDLGPGAASVQAAP